MNNLSLEGFGDSQEGLRYSFKETVTDTTSSPVAIKSSQRNALVSVFPESPKSSATVEYTISSLRDVRSGSALWLPWANGEVTKKTVDTVNSNICAVRLVSTGKTTWEIVS